jgi:hypothetical protein
MVKALDGINAEAREHLRGREAYTPNLGNSTDEQSVEQTLFKP